MRAIQVDRRYYLSVLESLPTNLRAFLDDDIRADKFYLVFIEGNPQAGFCTNKNGYMNGLFSLLEGTGNRLLDLRVAASTADASEDATTLELFCTGEKIRSKYENRGFSTAIEANWDIDLATSGWDYAKFGKPNVYTLRKQIR